MPSQRFKMPRAVGPKWEVTYTCTEAGQRFRRTTWFSGPRTREKARAKALWMADSGNGETDIVITELKRDGRAWYRGRRKA